MKPSNRVSLKEIRTFCVAAEQRSFRDTAEALFLTPSAVSHQVKSLEEALNIKLFERLTRSIELTDAGRLLYEEISPLILEFDQVMMRHQRSDSRNVLRVSVQPFFASELIVPNLAEFTERFPHIDIKLDTSDESLQKHPATADISIRIFRTAPQSLLAHRLFRLRLVPAASPTIAKRMKADGTEAIADLPRIVHESRPNAWRDWEKKSGISLPKVARVVRFDSMIAVARAVERGVGIALVPLELSESRFESGALVRIFEEELETTDAYYLVCRAEDNSNPAIKDFQHWALQRFEVAA